MTLLTSLYISDLCYPGGGTWDLLNGLLVALASCVAMRNIILWIKNWTGGDFQ